MLHLCNLLIVLRSTASLRELGFSGNRHVGAVTETVPDLLKNKGLQRVRTRRVCAVDWGSRFISPGGLQN